MSSFLLIVLIAATSFARGAHNTEVSVKITRGTPIESLASDGSVTGVSQAVVGTPYQLVSVNGAQIILQDAQGARYQMALSSTDYSPTTAPATPATNSVAQAVAPANASPVDSGLSSAPPQVQKTIASNSEGKTVNKVERNQDDGEVSYEVEMTSADGAEWDMSVGQEGTLLSIDVPLSQVPEAGANGDQVPGGLR